MSENNLPENPPRKLVVKTLVKLGLSTLRKDEYVCMQLEGPNGMVNVTFTGQPMLKKQALAHILRQLHISDKTFMENYNQI